VILLDWVGLIVSGFLLGPGYIIYVLFLSIAQELTRLLVALAVNVQIKEVFISGIFGFTSFTGINLTDFRGMMIILAGPLVSFLIYRLTGGLGNNPKGAFFNPLVKVRNPLAMISLRFALVSLVISCWEIIRQW